MSNIEASAHWDALAAKADRWADFADATATENPEPYRKEARLYRNVAQSLRLTDATGVPHCGCTTPPHVLRS